MWFTFVGALRLWYLKLFYIFEWFYVTLWKRLSYGSGGVYICGKNRFTFVGVLRWWAGLRLTALQGQTIVIRASYVKKSI